MDFYTNSMLKDWKLCKNKYYYKYVKNLVIPQKEDNFELGKKVHALISYKLNGFDTTLLEQSADEDVLAHYHSILNYKLLSQEKFLAEWGFTARLSNTTNFFIGRIDAVFYDKTTNTYTIADWKTGMKIPNNPMSDVQAQIYLYAFYRAQSDLSINITTKNLKFVFVQTPSLHETSFCFSDELYKTFEENFLTTINEIKQYKYHSEKAANKACQYCEYRFICNR